MSSSRPLQRFDHHPVLLVGLAALVGAIPLRRLAVVSAAATATIGTVLLLWSLRSEVLSESNGLEPMILGLQPFATSTTSIDVVRISVWASLVALALAAVSIGACRRRVAPIALATLLTSSAWVGRVRRRSSIARGTTRVTSSAVEEIRDLVDGVDVDFALPAASNSTDRMMPYQFHLPYTEFTVVDDALVGTSPIVFARVGTRGDEPELSDAGATLVWRDPRGRHALWER